VASPATRRFGYRVAQERKQRGWSVQQMAGKCGVSRGTIARLEAGERGCMLDAAILIAAALGIPLDGLTVPCERCGDKPMNGWTCNLCGAAGAEPQQRGESRNAG
jgi:transcriptional regulator with XRE-family HTH domain